MLSNQEFLAVIRESFKTYLSIDTSRSTAKLKVLHGNIAKDIRELLGPQYTVLSQGIGNDSEGSIQGRYYPKNVDITVSKKRKTRSRLCGEICNAELLPEQQQLF